MAENELNYSSSNLAGGGGGMEERINSGVYGTPEDSVHSPKYIPTSVDHVELPEGNSNPVKQDDIAVNYDKVILKTEQKEDYILYIYYYGQIEFEFANKDAQEVRDWVAENKPSIYLKLKPKQYEQDVGIRYRFHMKQSRKWLKDNGYDLEELKAIYHGDSQDISPYFKEDSIHLNIESNFVELFLVNTLEEYETSLEVASILKYFTNDASNRVDYYIGADYTKSDVGFYMDKSGNLRCVYDPHYLYRSHVLIKDIVEHGQALEEYSIGIVPKVRTVMFVITKPLVERLTRTYGDLHKLAARYNNEKYKEENLPVFNDIIFERILDIQTNTLVDATDLFGRSIEHAKKTLETQ